MKRLLLLLTLLFAGVTAVVLLSLQYPGEVVVTAGEWRVAAAIMRDGVIFQLSF